MPSHLSPRPDPDSPNERIPEGRVPFNRAVLTIATGKRVYQDMAIALARSFLFWNRSSGICFSIATDLADGWPEDLREVHFQTFPAGHLGKGFTVKLNVDRLAPGRQTLFIDADSLVMGPLDPVFDQLSGSSVAVVGANLSEGEWFGDIAGVCQRFSLPFLPKFNGGLYYVEPGPLCESVYARSRALESHYDHLGLIRLRGLPNEELLLAISMGLAGLRARPDSGTIYGDLFICPLLTRLDVVKGLVRLSNPGPAHPLHRVGYPEIEIEPKIVHFLGDFTTKWPYRTEELTLTLMSRWGLRASLARLLARSLYKVPAALMERTKDLLRPVFRRLFGTRRVKRSERIWES